jgi:monofunctional biosynthetic peptidoglycan transglycosylase
MMETPRKGLLRARGAIRSLGSRIPGKGRPWLRLVLALLLLPVVSVFFWFLVLPWPLALRWKNPTQTSFMEYRIKEARRAGVEFAIRQEWLPLEEISSNLPRAVLAAEDDRFYQHQGIDWRALAEELDYQGDTAFSWRSADDRKALWAAISYLRAHRDQIKGRSTLTQQLAKNLYFTPDRSFVRKLNEAVVAKRLELFLSKERILEIYLNVVEWGPGIFGAEAAAQTYFDRNAGDLTLDHAAALAATLPHPLTSNPSFRPAQMAWRRALLLARLRSPPPPSLEVEVLVLPDTFGVSIQGRTNNQE